MGMTQIMEEMGMKRKLSLNLLTSQKMDSSGRWMAEMGITRLSQDTLKSGMVSVKAWFNPRITGIGHDGDPLGYFQIRTFVDR